MLSLSQETTVSTRDRKAHGGHAARMLGLLPEILSSEFLLAQLSHFRMLFRYVRLWGGGVSKGKKVNSLTNSELTFTTESTHKGVN